MEGIVEQIKRFRGETGCGLREAKDFVMAHGSYDAAIAVFRNGAPSTATVPVSLEEITRLRNDRLAMLSAMRAGVRGFSALNGRVSLEVWREIYEPMNALVKAMISVSAIDVPPIPEYAPEESA